MSTDNNNQYHRGAHLIDITAKNFDAVNMLAKNAQRLFLKGYSLDDVKSLLKDRGKDIDPVSDATLLTAWNMYNNNQLLKGV